MSDDVIDIETRRKPRPPSREKRQPPHETSEQVLRRALVRARLPLVPREHEVAVLIWRAAEAAGSDRDKAATFLEMAAQRLRKKGGDDNEPPPAGA